MPLEQAYQELAQQEEAEEEEHYLYPNYRQGESGSSPRANHSSWGGRPQREGRWVPINKPHKKRKKLMNPPIKETPKKAKLLPSPISSMRTTKLHLLFIFDVGLYALS